MLATFVEGASYLPGRVESLPGPDAAYTYFLLIGPQDIATAAIPVSPVDNIGVGDLAEADAHIIVPQELLPHLDVSLRSRRKTNVPSRYGDNVQLQQLAQHRDNADKIKYAEAVRDPKIQSYMLAKLCHLFEVP
jgi:hypothetical protein